MRLVSEWRCERESFTEEAAPRRVWIPRQSLCSPSLGSVVGRFAAVGSRFLNAMYLGQRVSLCTNHVADTYETLPALLFSYKCDAKWFMEIEYIITSYFKGATWFLFKTTIVCFNFGVWCFYVTSWFSYRIDLWLKLMALTFCPDTCYKATPLISSPYSCRNMVVQHGGLHGRGAAHYIFIYIWLILRSRQRFLFSWD